MLKICVHLQRKHTKLFAFDINIRWINYVSNIKIIKV